MKLNSREDIFVHLRVILYMEHNSNNGRATTVELLRTWEGYGCVHEWVLRVGRALRVSVGAPRGWQTVVGGCSVDAGWTH